MRKTRGLGLSLLKSPSYKIPSAEDGFASKVTMEATIRDKAELCE